MNAFGIALLIAVILGILFVTAVVTLIVVYHEAKKLERNYFILHDYMMKQGEKFKENFDD